MIDFIEKDKTKKILFTILIISILASIVVLIIPIRKISVVSNDTGEKVPFKLDDGNVKFIQYIETYVSDISMLTIPIINYVPEEKQEGHIKIFDSNNKIIYDSNFEFDSNNIFIDINNVKNDVNQMLKLELNLDFNKIQLYKIEGNDNNFLYYNGEKYDQAMINYQKGKVSAKYRVWYPVLLSTLMFTLLGTSTKKEKNND